jgi:hypothetical protein
MSKLRPVHHSKAGLAYGPGESSDRSSVFSRERANAFFAALGGSLRQVPCQSRGVICHELKRLLVARDLPIFSPRGYDLLVLRSDSLGPVVQAGGSLAGNDSSEASSTASELVRSASFSGLTVLRRFSGSDFAFSAITLFPIYFDARP